jgi:hypothetical protein
LYAVRRTGGASCKQGAHRRDDTTFTMPLSKTQSKTVTPLNPLSPNLRSRVVIRRSVIRVQRQNEVGQSYAWLNWANHHENVDSSRSVSPVRIDVKIERRRLHKHCRAHERSNVIVEDVRSSDRNSAGIRELIERLIVERNLKAV